MPSDVLMPALGLMQETGKVLLWLKAEGDEVSEGDPLVEVETDKTTLEIPSPASGTLAAITAANGDDVPVGNVIAKIFSPGEPVSTFGGDNAAIEIEVAAPIAENASSEKAAGSSFAHNPAAQAVSTVSSKQPASPKARRLAAERGIDLRQVRGSGPGGAISETDLAVPEAGAATTTLPVGRAWQAMARRLGESWSTVPHFYLMRDILAARLGAWREQLREQTPGVTYSDLLLKVVSGALRDHPRMRGQWKEGQIHVSPEVHVGLAVAIEDGIVVPVIRRSDQLTPLEIAARRRDLITRARESRLRSEDVSDGVFTISNLGMYGVDSFLAIVNPPQAAILAVGRITDRVVAVDGRPAVQPVMTLSLCCDHRVVDGARAAEFLTALANRLEEPAGWME